MYSFVGRGRRQGPTTSPSSGRGMSSEQGENPECPHCHRWHSGVCRRVTGECLICGSIDHFLANCSREKEILGILKVVAVEDQ